MFSPSEQVPIFIKQNHYEHLLTRLSFVLGNMGRILLLLALCSAAQALTFNVQNPVQTFLNTIPNLQISGPGAEFAKVIAAGPAPQRLPVAGFG